MPQITGPQTGTAANDVFRGRVFILDLSGDLSDTGILDADITTLAGNDRVVGKADVVPIVIKPLVTTAGVARSKIDVGDGDDVFSAISSSESVTTAGGTNFAYGMLSGSVNGQAGADRLVFSGASLDAADGTGIGVFDVTINGGADRDVIAIKGSTSAPSRSGESTVGMAIGVDRSTVKSGIDDDTIKIVATVSASGGFSGSGPGTAMSVAGSLVSGEEGNDRIVVSARGAAPTGSGIALSASRVTGGAGDDTLRFTGNGLGGARFTGEGIGTGTDSSVVNGDDGDDVLTFVGKAEGDGFVGGTGIAYGVKLSEVNEGSGNERIRATASAIGAFGAEAYGVLQSTINGDGGDDRIVISAKASASLPETVIGAGAAESVISGGEGNDTIKISAQQNFGEWDIDDVLLSGDGGDDIFDVGIGSGNILGGSGNDVAILKYFDSDTMTIAAISDGIRVSGTQNKLGIEDAWSQDITGVERFRLAGKSLDATQVVDLFG